MTVSTLRLPLLIGLSTALFACSTGAPAATSALATADNGTAGTAPADVQAQAAPTTTATEAPTSAPTSQPAAPTPTPEAAHAEPAHPTVAEALADGASGHYGAPFSSAAPPIALTDALTQCADTGTPCKVEGVIERVCQARGCWFTLSAPNVAPTVRVRMLNYGFLVPRNTSGATAILEGTLARTTIPQEMAQHYADDEAAAGTAPARQVAGPEDTFEFTITGATITRM
jgi:hypothetical protein